MATTIFENIIDSNLGEKISLKGGSFIQKSDSSEFRDLVKEKTLQSKTESSKSEPKTQSESKNSFETNVIKQSKPVKDQVSDDNIAMTVPASEIIIHSDQTVPLLPVIDRELQIEDEIIALEQENIFEEDIDQFKEEIIPSINLLEDHNDIVRSPALADNDTNQDKVDEEIAVVPVIVPEVTKVAESVKADQIHNLDVGKPIVIAELPIEDQAIHQSLKTFDLPVGFTSDELPKDIELLADKLQTLNQLGSNNKVEELNSKYESLVKPVVDNQSEKNIIENNKPIIIVPSLNLALADTSKHGKEVISKMQTSTNDGSTVSVVEEGLVLDNETILVDLSGKDNNNTSQRGASALENFGAVMQQVNDETFEITFKGQDFTSKHSEMPRPSMQVSLAVSEVLNSSSISGKKQITINLYPQTLGAVKVEILSQVGQDGASKVESIKISADKHETLVMLEERKADLAKTLREVNGTEEKEATLQFEMSQDQGKGQGAYFTSLEERNNWMSKFVGLVDDDLQTGDNLHGIDEYATRGIVTEDKVDLVA